MRKPIAVAAFGAALAAYAPILGAQTSSAPISRVEYHVTFNRESGAKRTVASAMSFDVAGTAAVILSLPAWTPGAYEIDNFARNVSSFGAIEGGASLDWNKTDPYSWRIRPTGSGRVTVSFNYEADSLDNANSWARRDFLLFNGTNLFLYPAGLSLEFPASVTIATEPDWKVVTGMQRTGTLTYSAQNYHDLVDMPFFVGAFDVDSTTISGKWVRFASYPAGSVAGNNRAEVLAALQRVIPPEVKVFGEAPWRDYSVMQITDSTYPDGSYVGLEHQSSHVDIVAPSLIGNAVLASLYAHEIFHSWNVKRLRPADMAPYRYDRMQPTKLLWISEGITDYYADLAEVRGGQVTAQGFYDLTRSKMEDVAALPPTSVEDASLSSWIHVRDGTEYLYYPKGSLAGMLLDILIRDATDNRASLDDVMRSLYMTTYKRGRGFTDEEWWATASRLAGGKSFEDFKRRYVDGRDSYPYASVMALAGLIVRQDSTMVPRIGVFTLPDSAGQRIAQVDSGSAAAGAGILPGDYLISAGELPAADPDWIAKFRLKYAGSPEGTPLPVRIKRAGTEQTLTAKLRFVPVLTVRISEDSAASAKAREIRAGLLTGTTRP